MWRMNVLAFDTSTSRCVIGLHTANGRTSFDVEAGNTHSQLLLPAVEKMLAEAGVSFAALDAIGFGAGPGAFTGVRIACACAQGIGLAHDIPLVPVGTLEAIASTFGADSPEPKRVWVINDARMGEVYVAGYERDDNGWRAHAAPKVQKPEFALPEGDWALAGDAFLSVQALQAFAPKVRITHVSADGLLDATLRRFHRNETVHARDAQPVYVRDKVASTEAERALAAAARNAP